MMLPPSSSSSSSQGLMGAGGPASFLSAPVVDSVGGGAATGHFSEQLLHPHRPSFGGASLSTSCNKDTDKTRLQSPLGLNKNNLNSKSGGGGGEGESFLLRQSSSPAGFRSYLSNGGNASSGHGKASFRRQEDGLSLSQQREDKNANENIRNAAQSYASSGNFGMGSYSWDDHDRSNAIVFSSSPTKPPKFEFSVEMGSNSVEKFLQIPQDSIPCKVRAKRGCATHPRSIAERERRIRISKKLKKIQELVPNMDKQTSYADMLDLALQHIKGLQNQVQKLKKEQENCTCRVKEPR